MVEVVGKVEGILGKIEDKAQLLGALGAFIAGYTNSTPYKTRQVGLIQYIMEGLQYEAKYAFGVPHPDAGVNRNWGLPPPLGYLTWKWFNDASSWSAPVKNGIILSIIGWIAKDLGIEHPLAKRIIGFLEKLGYGSLVMGLVGGALLHGSPSTANGNANIQGQSYVYK